MKDPQKMTDEEIDAEIARIEGKSVETLSDKEIDEQIQAIEKTRYGVLDVIDTATKPIQKAANVVDYFTAAPIRAAAIRGKQEFDKPESTAGSVFSAASKGATESALRNPLDYDPRFNYAEVAREYGVSEEPLGEFIPGAPDIISDLPANKAAGLATEVIFDPFTVAGRSFKPLGTMLKEKSIANTEQALARMSDVGPVKTSELIEATKLQSAANTMQENNLIKYITNPEKLREAINGKYVSAPDPRFPGKRTPKLIKPGLKQKIGEKLDASISKMDAFMSKNNITASKQDLSQKILDDIISQNESIGSGTMLKQSDAKKASEAINGIFKVGMDSDNLSIRDIVELKRAAQDYVYKLRQAESFGVQGVGNTKNIYEAVERTLSDYLNNFAISKYSDKKAGLDFLKSNQEYSDLMTLDNITQSAKYKSATEKGLLGTIGSMAAGGAIGTAAGINPAVSAGAFGVAKGVGSSVSGNIPAATARVQDLFNIKGIPSEQYLNIGQRPAAFSRGVFGDQSGREPQSLPMQLIEFQIPRNSNEILANKDIVIAKLAQMSDNPELVAQFQDAIEKHPEKLKKALPAIIMAFPNLFEEDDYDRVDGMIINPMLKQKALKDLKNNKNLSTREKAFKAKRLEMEGILE